MTPEKEDEEAEQNALLPEMDERIKPLIPPCGGRLPVQACNQGLHNAW